VRLSRNLRAKFPTRGLGLECHPKVYLELVMLIALGVSNGAGD